MTRLFATLAFAGIRHRRLQSALTLIVVASAAAALTVAFGVGRVADRPFERTFEQTQGAHITAVGFRDADADLESLERLPEVVASTGVQPWVVSSFRNDGELFGIRLVGVPDDPEAVAVSRPLLEDGTWPTAGQVLLERSFARFLGLDTGDRLVLGRGATPVVVSGIAVVPSGEPYPQTQPGMAFGLERTIASIQPDRSAWARILGLRIQDPEAAPAVARRAQNSLGRAVEVSPWTEERDEAAEMGRTVTVIVGIFSALLLLAGAAVLATLVSGRVVSQIRDVGLLKTAGLTPGQVARVFLVEQLGLALVGCLLGLLLGRLATPLFTSRSAALLNASETPPLDAVTVAFVLAIVLVAVAVSTAVPTLRAGRRTTAEALHGGLSGAAGRSRLGRLADRLGLPVPAALGARASFARPGRTALTAFSLALTVSSVVATLGMEASLDVASVPPPAPPLAEGLDTPAWDPVDDDAGEGATLRPIVYGLDGVLLFVGLVNLVATIILAVRERVRDLGVLKAVGLTPRQVGGSVLSSQAVVATLAALAGIPLGLGLFRLGIEMAGGSDEFAYPAWWQLVVVAPAIVAAVVVLTVPFARRAASIRVADALRYE